MLFRHWPPEWWMIVWGIAGLFVGSFLNVAIHRWPLADESVNKPRRSRCPSCKTQLTWKENLPLVSWLVLRGRCRTCAWSIPWRYPLIEALNGGLWVLVAWIDLPQHPGLALVHSLVLSALLVASAIDFDCFEIPDEVSIGGIVLAPVCALLVPELHADTWVSQWIAGPGVEVGRLAALGGAAAGILVGGGILWGIGIVGSRVYGRDAMGFGDVKLLAAGGGFVGPGGALFALAIGSFVAAIVGLLNMARLFLFLRHRARLRGRRQRLSAQFAVARVAGRYLPFGPYLALGIGIALLGWDSARGWFP